MAHEIKTKRLVLRPRIVEDFEDCMSMDRDPQVTQFIDGPWDNPELHRAFILDKMAEEYTHPYGYWTIFTDTRPRNFLGWVMIVPGNDTGSKAEIGWRLTKRTWGQGIATEATAAVVKLILEHDPNISVFASIHPENIASFKVAEKIGMSFSHKEQDKACPERIYVM